MFFPQPFVNYLFSSFLFISVPFSLILFLFETLVRYIQVGNAVAVPVARALGYSLALALKGLSGTEPLFTLPEEFPKIADTTSPTSPEVHL